MLAFFHLGERRAKRRVFRVLLPCAERRYQVAVDLGDFVFIPRVAAEQVVAQLESLDQDLIACLLYTSRCV